MGFINWGMIGPHRRGWPRSEWLKRGDLTPHGDAMAWGCPCCGYEVLFWPKDEATAEDAARSHMLNQHRRQIWA